MDEIPPELIINFDQTGLNVVPVSDWTMESAEVKRVEVAGKDDKKQLTALLAGLLTGDFLPPQIIYQGKTTDFPENWHITFSINHWSNEIMKKEYLDNVLLPYISEKENSRSCR